MACATGSGTALVTGDKRTPLDPGLVNLYLEAPANYEVIGLVSASSDAGWTEQDSQDYAVQELKNQAAKLLQLEWSLAAEGKDVELHIRRLSVPVDVASCPVDTGGSCRPDVFRQSGGPRRVARCFVRYADFAFSDGSGKRIGRDSILNRWGSMDRLHGFHLSDRRRRPAEADLLWYRSSWQRGTAANGIVHAG